LIALILGCIFVSSALRLDCDFKTVAWTGMSSSIFYCETKSNPGITTRDVVIDGFDGADWKGKSENDILGVDVQTSGHQVHYFPKFPGEFSQNAQGIRFHNSGLKEIHREDLKPFAKLVYLRLSFNEIEYLEENLFEFNENLAIIYLYSNKITSIGLNVFDGLDSLKYLDLDDNKCISKNVYNNRSEVLNLIREVKTNCGLPYLNNAIKNQTESISQKIIKIQEDQAKDKQTILTEINEKIGEAKEKIGEAKEDLVTILKDLEASHGESARMNNIFLYSITAVVCLILLFIIAVVISIKCKRSENEIKSAKCEEVPMRVQGVGAQHNALYMQNVQHEPEELYEEIPENY
jgi:hypothetical protein